MAYIIAEIGSNFTTIEDCLKSISLAKACGADAVKFQHYTNEEMYGYNTGGADLLPEGWIPLLSVKAEACGIDFMCTFFSPEKLLKYDKYVKAHKIASSDLNYRELLEAAYSTGKHIYLSTGGHGINDIAKSLIVCDFAPFQLTLMYCESVYPSYINDWRKIDLLEQEFSLPVGISDHSLELFNFPDVPVIEKHVNLCGVLSGDSAHSLYEHQFQKFVKAIRGIDGNHYNLLSGEEHAMSTHHNRRLIATKNIVAGETLKRGVNYGAFRSQFTDRSGLHPMCTLMEGKLSKCNIPQGDSITPECF